MSEEWSSFKKWFNRAAFFGQLYFYHQAAEAGDVFGIWAWSLLAAGNLRIHWFKTWEKGFNYQGFT